MKRNLLLAVFGVLAYVGVASAQSPSVIYTWNGTGNPRSWGRGGGQPNFVELSNNIAGQLTVTEVGDQFEPGSLDPLFYGKSFIVADSGDRVRESSFAEGGIDLTGLQFVEMDISHTGTGNVSVQPYIGTGRNSTYTWFGPGPDYLPSGTPWSIPGNTATTVRIPIYQLLPEQQAYNRSIGLKVFDHIDQGYLTWTISEVRSVGTPLTERILASHNVGSIDNGLNGAYVNFDGGAVLGHTPNNPGGGTVQDQTGLTLNASGSGSLQWTDKGGAGTAESPSGAAITWGNGTAFYDNNSFYERPADFSNYNRVTFRMSASEVTPGAGGSLGVQAFFQTGNYEATQISNGAGVGANGEIALPIDGQFHDLTFPLDNITNRLLVPAFGVNLFAHLTDLNINVDQVRFFTAAGVQGDYNGNGTVDAADYVLWRNGGPLQNEVNTPGTVDASDYTAWRARFGNTSGSGSLVGAAVPEPSALLLACSAVVGALVTAVRRQK